MSKILYIASVIIYIVSIFIFKDILNYYLSYFQLSNPFGVFQYSIVTELFLILTILLFYINKKVRSKVDYLFILIVNIILLLAISFKFNLIPVQITSIFDMPSFVVIYIFSFIVMIPFISAFIPLLLTNIYCNLNKIKIRSTSNLISLNYAFWVIFYQYQFYILKGSSFNEYPTQISTVFASSYIIILGIVLYSVHHFNPIETV
jgi:hypothetical protein